jgi:hypothetical protein
MRFTLIFLLVLLASCKEEEAEQPSTSLTGYEFRDGFEASTFQNLFPEDGARWTNVQIVDPDSGQNRLELDSTRFSEGNKSLRVLAMPSGNILSKAGIEKSGFEAGRNNRILIRADFFLSEEGSLANVFLLDLECCACWDPAVPDNQCPGVRLMLDETGEFIHLERGKIGLPTLTQFQLPMPRNEWVRLEWEMTLSDESPGQNTIRLNGEVALSESGINLPSQTVFDSLFSAEGIDFSLQEPLQYHRFQIGVTANPSSESSEIWVDNVYLRIGS